MNRSVSETLTRGRDHGIPATIAVAAVLFVAAAAMAGIGATAIGWPLLLVLLGLPIAGAVFYRPFVGVVLIAATIPVEVMLTFGGLGLGRAIGLAVFAAWLLQKAAGRQSWQRVVSGAFFPAAVGFLALVLASILWAEHPEPVRSGFIRLAQMVALAIIIIDLCDSARKLDLIAKALVLSALVAAGITFYQHEILGARRAGSDVAGGVNDTAILLVTLLPLGFYLLRSSSRFVWKLLATLFIAISALSVVTTLSRMNLLLLPPLILLLFVLSARDRRARGWLLAVAVAGGVAASLFVPWDKLEERTQTIDTYVEGTVRFGQEEAAISPRGYHLRIGLAIAREHPLLGAGYGNYGYLFRDEYQYQVPGSGEVYTTARSPHSAYLGLAADLGAVGLACWLLLLAVCASAGIRARRGVRRGGPPRLFPLTESLLVMLGLHMFAYGFYSQHQMDKLLWVILAMCVAAGYVAGTSVGTLSESKERAAGRTMPASEDLGDLHA